MPWHVGPITIPNPFEPLPRLWQNLNVITDIIEENCHPTWSVYIKTAIPASKHAILFLISPDITQIIQNYLRPGGRAGGGKLRLLSPGRWLDDGGHRKRKHFGGGIPDADSLIADRIPGRAYFGQRVAGKVEGWVWSGIDILDRVGWYWMIAFAAEDFTTEWISGIMQSKFCSSHFTAFASGKGRQQPLLNQQYPLPIGDQWTWAPSGGWYGSGTNTISRPPRGAKGRIILIVAIHYGKRLSGSTPTHFRLRARGYYPRGAWTYSAPQVLDSPNSTLTWTLEMDIDASVGLAVELIRDSGNYFCSYDYSECQFLAFCEAK